MLSNMMGEIIRISDVVGRLAGEEFAIILPETDIRGAEMFAERFRKHVELTPLVVNYHTFNITVSIGAASYQDCAGESKSSLELLEGLMYQAEKALHRAKDRGGNCVELYSA
jgi:diguanylate cyclase (GGDEF)-like protein